MPTFSQRTPLQGRYTGVQQVRPSSESRLLNPNLIPKMQGGVVRNLEQGTGRNTIQNAIERLNGGRQQRQQNRNN